MRSDSWQPDPGQRSACLWRRRPAPLPPRPAAARPAYDSLQTGAACQPPDQLRAGQRYLHCSIPLSLYGATSFLDMTTIRTHIGRPSDMAGRFLWRDGPCCDLCCWQRPASLVTRNCEERNASAAAPVGLVARHAAGRGEVRGGRGGDRLRALESGVDSLMSLRELSQRDDMWLPRSRAVWWKKMLERIGEHLSFLWKLCACELCPVSYDARGDSG